MGKDLNWKWIKRIINVVFAIVVFFYAMGWVISANTPSMQGERFAKILVYGLPLWAGYTLGIEAHKKRLLKKNKKNKKN